MTAAGIGNDSVFVPVLPSFDGFFTDLSKGAKKGGKQAGNDFASAMGDSLKGAEKQVEKSSGVMERAQERFTSASEDTRVAQQRLVEVMEKENATVSQITAARNRYERAMRKETAAQKDAEKAVEQHEKAQRELQVATDQAGDAVEQSTRGLGDYEGALDGAGAKVKDFLKVAAGFAGIAGIGATLAEGMDISGTIANMNRQLGLTGPAAASAAAEVSSVMRSGMVDSADVAAEAVGALNAQFRYLGSEGEQTAAELSDNFLAFTKTFEVDMAEATQTAGQLVHNGLAADVESAVDLMTTAMQRVPMQMRDELPEIINEYGVNFAGLGLSGEEAFSMLVSAADKGKWALDKTGDSLKEFQIRGSDMSKASVEAYEAVGLNAEEMSRKIAEGGDGAREALEATAQGILGIEDPAERANTAIALFGTPIEDLSIDQIPAFLESLTGMENGMVGAEGSSQALADEISGSLQGRINALKGAVSDLAGQAFMALWDMVQNQIIPAFQTAGDWIQRNRGWLEPLAWVAGSVAAALGGLALATWGYSAAATAGGKATRGLSLAFGALTKHPIIAAISAIVGGLLYFFTQTETGKQVWESFMDLLGVAWQWLQNTLAPVFQWVADVAVSAWSGIKAGWDMLVQGLSWAYDNIIQPVFSGFMTAGKVLFAVLATAVLTPLTITWNLLSSAIQWGWENLIKPAWAALQAAGQFMWTNVLQPVFGWIQAGWSLLASGIQWYWQNVIMVAWGALQTAATWMWTNVLSPVFGWIGDRWTDLSTGIRWAYDSIIKPAWDALSSALTWLYDNVVRPVLQWFGDRWNDMANVLHAGWRWIDENVFAGLKRGLEIVQDAFGIARDAIGKAWDGIKAKAAAPVKFVIETIFNNGIVEAWNKVADWVDLPTIDKYEPAWLGQFAEGTSRVPGPRTRHDNVHMMSMDGKFGLSLRGGESVLVPEVTDALGPDQIDGMNAAAKVGGTQGVLRYLGGFAGGGVIGSITDLVGRFFPGMSITSTLRPGDPGHHGTGNAVDFSNGTDSTPQMRSATKFFHDNYAPALLELIHSPSPYNVKNGQNVGDGFGLYGAGTMNAHRNHVHVAAAGPLPEPGDPITPVPSGGGGGGVINWLRNRVADVLDSVFSPIANMIPDLGGMIGGLPRAAFEKMTGAVSDFIRGKADESGAYHGAVGGGVEQWRGLVEDVLTDKGFSVNLADTVLRRMDQESGGNPRAINNWDSNAAAGTPSKGLMQVIDPTFAAHKDAGYDDIWDPESNIRASMNYAMSRYGSLPAAYNKAGGYHDGGLAPEGQGWLRKTALEPEFVLNPAMTEAFINWMRATPHGESAAVVARELAEAYAGGNWGYGELASYLGDEIAKATVDVVAAVGRADRGFRDWAAATEEQGRLGTPEEWARHYGAQAGQALGGEALGLLGLESLAGHTFRDSLVDLVNAARPYANQELDEHGVPDDVRFGEMSADMWQPVEVLDDDGRVLGTTLEPANTTVDTTIIEPVAADDEDSATAVTATGGAREVVIQVEGDAISTATLQKVFEENKDELGDLKIRVEKVEGELTASVTSGLTGIV